MRKPSQSLVPVSRIFGRESELSTGNIMKEFMVCQLGLIRLCVSSIEYLSRVHFHGTALGIRSWNPNMKHTRRWNARVQIHPERIYRKTADQTARESAPEVFQGFLWDRPVQRKSSLNCPPHSTCWDFKRSPAPLGSEGSKRMWEWLFLFFSLRHEESAGSARSGNLNG